MNDEPPSPSGARLDAAALAALRSRYSARQVIEMFRTLGLPVCDDQAVITQVAQRERTRWLQARQSRVAHEQQAAAAWLEAYDLLAAQESRRALLLTIQVEVNHTLTFRCERLASGGKPYAPENRVMLKEAAKAGFNLSDDLAERFLSAFEHVCNLRFGNKVPISLPKMDVEARAAETFSGAFTSVLPRIPAGEATAFPPPQPTGPLPVVRAKPAAKVGTPPAPRPPARPQLTPENARGKLVITRQGETSEYALDKDEITIGRTSESDLCFKEDLRISRVHATIRREPTAFMLTDQNSGNGTLVNGTRIKAPTALRSGDQIRMGQTEITFVLEPKTGADEI